MHDEGVILMDKKTVIPGICPSCHHTIEVPDQLEIFSCVYCGKRLTPNDLVSTEASAVPEAHPDELYRKLALDLPRAVYAEPNTLKYMTRNGYPNRFKDYTNKYQNLFALILPLCQGTDGKATAEHLANDVIDALEQWAESSRKGLTSKDALLEEAKFTLCLLTIPAIRSLNHNACEVLADALHTAWVTKFPKNPFQSVIYEEIISGFKPKRLCYITTATCRQAGKPNDCQELTAFRAFRDGYLICQPEGEALIARYYDLAPGIVMAINLCRDPDEIYPAIWQTYLRPCYDALSAGDNALCQRIYTQMMTELPKKLSSGQRFH